MSRVARVIFLLKAVKQQGSWTPPSWLLHPGGAAPVLPHYSVRRVAWDGPRRDPLLCSELKIRVCFVYLCQSAPGRKYVSLTVCSPADALQQRRVSLLLFLPASHVVLLQAVNRGWRPSLNTRQVLHLWMFLSVFFFFFDGRDVRCIGFDMERVQSALCLFIQFSGLHFWETVVVKPHMAAHRLGGVDMSSSISAETGRREEAACSRPPLRLQIALSGRAAAKQLAAWPGTRCSSSRCRPTVRETLEIA